MKGIIYKRIYKEKYGKFDLSSDRAIDLRNVPLCSNGISWKDCEGLKLDFIFDGITGVVEILEVRSEQRSAKIYIKGFTPNEGCTIHLADLAQCKLYNCLFVKPNTIKNNRPDLIKYLVNKEDENLCVSSNKTIECVCPICHTRKKMLLNTLSKYGLRCQKCKDGISYPEKFLLSLLNQLNIQYTYQATQKVFNWCKRYSYDFYIPDLKLIIETHGMQHYNGAFVSLGGRTATEEQKNDENKKNLAMQNGIEKYVIIDCRKSNMIFIKNSILESKLLDYLDCDASEIDWLKCNIEATSNFVFEVCRYYNETDKNITNISHNFKISDTTIRKYLLIGTEIGLCNYDPIYTHGNNRYPIEVYKNGKYLGTYKSKKYIVNNSEVLFNEKISSYGINSVLNQNRPSYKNFYFKRKEIA